ncbi:MAG: hypothetical protein JF627_03955 [Alphaproteobacteria bacterium]|nr:hypothetical protein [Alphaproteobacteria bacterium]
MAKKVLPFVLVLAVAATSAWAQDSLTVQLSGCLAIPGVLQRLACYDRVAHGVVPASRTSAVAPERPALRTAPSLAVPSPEGLGSERLRRATPVRRPSAMLAQVVSISYDPHGHFTVTLDNGQVWRQLAGDTAVLQGTSISTVRISRGALGSYDLNVEGRNASYRVMRLQ